MSGESHLPPAIPVAVSAFESPTDFYVQKLKDAEQIKNFHKRIREAKDAASNMEEKLKVGGSYIAYNKITTLWSRCTMESLKENPFAATVKGIDDGQRFRVESRDNLLACSQGLAYHPSFATHCMLPIHIPKPLQADAGVIFTGLTRKKVSMRTIATFEGKSVVELIVDGQNLTDKLVNNGFGTRLPFGSAYINYVKSTADFAIQLYSSAPQLSEILEFLKSYKQIQISRPEAGMIVAAFSKTLHAWKRAKILKIQRESFTVTLIDEGFIDDVELIGKIENQHIESISPTAYICKLRNVVANQKEEKCFSDFVLAESDNFRVETHSLAKDGKFIVDVLFQNQHIMDFLKGSKM